MEAYLAYLVMALVMVAVLGGVGYVVLRKVFLRTAEGMSQHIARALGQLTTAALDPRLANVSANAVRAARGGLTHLAAYAAAEGVSEDAARRQFKHSIERVSKVMDSAIKVPIIGGVGLDALLGLVPVAGDAASAAVSVSLIAKSVRYGIPREIITKMLANVLVDLVLGAIPLVGDLADIWFKANERNVALLREYLGDEATEMTAVDVERT